MLFPESFSEKSVILNLSQEGIRLPATKIFTLHHSSVSNTPARDKKVLVLLHGYPQNHTLYYELVHELSALGILEEWDIVIPDLPGYGRSSKIPSADGSHLANSKRAIASDIVSLINALFGSQQKFVVAGHDRGARIAYRLAKDHRDRVLGTCIMEIIPTKVVFQRMNYLDEHRMTFSTYHWIFLALPPPIPETLIGASSDFYFSHTIESWTGTRHRGHFDPIAVASWDYRAGASIDLEHDEDDERNGTAIVDCPLLILHSVEFGHKYGNVNEIWEALGVPGKVRIKAVGDDQVGHFIPLEAAQEIAGELVPWLNTLHAYAS
ncbi:alpha/beta-hydrolase [Dendrothele bispora CBS 962.96]|uniref:Alpha/beta-hydrolase n=1 Tax=Dendrothele bispora (strain CBS 962.96) TaxID=1314807 RepID=A0A4S8LL46_DENBC|nr:alpha/beta-hydrolase [Dendrothele bispora CBS 962.96]